jgi:hypothetical protein
MSTLLFRIATVKARDVDGTVNFTTDWLEFERSMAWAVSLTNDVADGVPVYDIEVSNDKVQVYPYSVGATGVALDSAIEAASMGWKYIRVKYTAAAATSGTITAWINIARR